MLTWRRLGVLLRQLPQGSRFVRAIGGDGHLWSTEAYLLAALVDLGAGANWQRSGGKGAAPRPIKRPGQDQTDKAERRLGIAVPVEEGRQILDNWGE